jgi:N-acetylmuramoyl-L-alanine amidase
MSLKNNGTPKIYLSPSKQNNNRYCVGKTNERDQMEALAIEIKRILDNEYQCETVIATPSLGIDSNGRPKEAKNNNCDIYLALHSNATGKTPPCNASGAVAFYHPNSSESKVLAGNIVKQLNAICPVKSNRYISVCNGMDYFNGIGYGEVRNPMIAGLIPVLAEVDFHDNQSTAQWIIDKKIGIAKAYVKAIVNTFNISKKRVEKLYRVQVGAFSNIINANEIVAKLKVAGFDSYIKYE